MNSVFERALLIVFLTAGIIAFACFTFLFFQIEHAIIEISNTVEQFNQNGIWGK